jgi:hypothetical protein
MDSIESIRERLADPKVEATKVPIAQGGATALHNLPSVWDLQAEPEWLVQDMIPLEAITLVSAASGTGKTWLAYAIAGAVAHGTAFLGKPVKQRPVVYLDGENPLAIVKRNLDGLGIPRTEEFKVWGGWHDPSPPGPDDSALLEYALDEEPLFVWDSLVEFHTGDEQSAKDTRKFMKFFRTLTNNGATVLILHHTGKAVSSKKYRGSSDIEAAVDMAYLVEGKSRDGALHSLTMNYFKSRFAPGQNFGMEFRQGQGFEAVAVPQGGLQRASTEVIVSGIITAHALPDGMNGTQVKALAKEQGIGKHAVDTFLKTWPNWKAGRGREKLYLPQEPAPAKEAA